MNLERAVSRVNAGTVNYGCGADLHFAGDHAVISHDRIAMINVIALTQLAFLTLGVVLSRILYRATGNATATTYSRIVIDQWYLLFAAPVIWIGFALLAARINRTPLTPGTARAIGVALAMACFAFFVSSTFVSFR